MKNQSPSQVAFPQAEVYINIQSFMQTQNTSRIQ